MQRSSTTNGKSRDENRVTRIKNFIKSTVTVNGMALTTLLKKGAVQGFEKMEIESALVAMDAIKTPLIDEALSRKKIFDVYTYLVRLPEDA